MKHAADDNVNDTTKCTCTSFCTEKIFLDPLLISVLRLDPVEKVISSYLLPLLHRNSSDSAEILVEDLLKIQRSLVNTLQLGAPRLANDEARASQALLREIELEGKMLSHSLAAHLQLFPPRLSFVAALIKRVLSIVSEAKSVVRGECEEELIDDTLLSWYLDHCINSNGLKTELNTKDESAVYYSTLALNMYRRTAVSLVPFAVVSPFVNVGLALWPAGFVACDVLAHLIEGGKVPISGNCLLENINYCAFDCNSRLRILELGAGVGLTAVALGTRYRNMESTKLLSIPGIDLTVTDYQNSVIENCKENIMNNCLAGDEADAFCQVRTALLDWNECLPDANSNYCSSSSMNSSTSLVATCSAHVVLAADCVYDASVFDGLCSTIKLALNNGSRLSFGVPPVAIVVQTHRNETTQKEFHQMLSKSCNIQSYRYKNGNLLPLGGAWISTLDKNELNRSKKLCNYYEAIELPQTGRYYIDMEDLLYVHFITLRGG